MSLIKYVVNYLESWIIQSQADVELYLRNTSIMPNEVVFKNNGTAILEINGLQIVQGQSISLNTNHPGAAINMRSISIRFLNPTTFAQILTGDIQVFVLPSEVSDITQVTCI